MDASIRTRVEEFASEIANQAEMAEELITEMDAHLVRSPGIAEAIRTA